MSRRKPTSTDPREVDFLRFVPQISPHLTEPYWLDVLVDVCRRSFLASAGLGPPVFACVSVPPQHGKTSTIQHAIACWLRYRPQDSLLYATYGRDLAREKSRETRDLAKIAGTRLRDDSRSLNTWTTLAGGGLRSRALVGGALTGTPGLRWIVIDDPYKGRREADSVAWRRDTWNSFSSNIVSRLNPYTSILINHTRWHEADLTGQLKSEQSDKWEFHNLPAINPVGQPLWPEGQPLELLADKRERSGEYEWWSLYMGEPRPREGKLFSGVQWFSALPTGITRYAIGVDLAYTKKTYSDRCVAVVLAEANGCWYVLEVIRKQVVASEFAMDLRGLSQRYPTAPMAIFSSSVEKGHADLMRNFGVPIQAIHATADKYLRAQPLSAAWNAGRVFLPRSTSWAEGFASRVLEFTGLGDADDDDTDAIAAAFSKLPSAGSPRTQREEPLEQQRPRREPSIPRGRPGKLGTW